MNSEYQLSNDDLISHNETLFVDGIGPIAQYHCYYDLLYSHGVIYFLRDLTRREIYGKLAAGSSMQGIHHLTTRLNALNSKISVYETQCQCHGSNKSRTTKALSPQSV